MINEDGLNKKFRTHTENKRRKKGVPGEDRHRRQIKAPSEVRMKRIFRGGKNQ